MTTSYIQPLAAALVAAASLVSVGDSLEIAITHSGNAGVEIHTALVTSRSFAGTEGDAIERERVSETETRAQAEPVRWTVPDVFGVTMHCEPGWQNCAPAPNDPWDEGYPRGKNGVRVFGGLLTVLGTAFGITTGVSPWLALAAPVVVAGVALFVRPTIWANEVHPATQFVRDSDYQQKWLRDHGYFSDPNFREDKEIPMPYLPSYVNMKATQVDRDLDGSWDLVEVAGLEIPYREDMVASLQLSKHVRLFYGANGAVRVEVPFKPEQYFYASGALGEELPMPNNPSQVASLYDEDGDQSWDTIIVHSTGWTHKLRVPYDRTVADKLHQSTLVVRSGDTFEIKTPAP